MFVLAVLVLVSGWWTFGRTPQTNEAVTPSPTASSSAAPTQAQVEKPAIFAIDVTTTATGNSIALSRTDLTSWSRSHNPGDELTMILDLEVPTKSQKSLPARVIGTDSRVFDVEAVVQPNDPERVALNVDSKWLTPDRYLVEVRTTESTHIPLRRFLLEVVE